MEVVSVFFLIIYLIISIMSCRWLYRTKLYDKTQKKYNYIFILLLPIAWVIILKFLAKETPGSHFFPNKQMYDNDTKADIGTSG